MYRSKTRSDGSVECYKTRLVTKGFTQENGIDYEETFVLVAHITSIRSLLIVATVRQWDIFQMDVKKMLVSMVIFLRKYTCLLLLAMIILQTKSII